MPTPDLRVGRNINGILVISPTIRVDVTPVMSTHGAYHANDYVGLDAVAMKFEHCMRVPGGGGFVDIAVVDYAIQSASLELWLFDTIVVPPADNAAWTLTDAEMKTCVGVWPFSTYFASAVNSFSPGANSSPKLVRCAAKSTTLYGVCITRGTPTYASGDLTFRMIVAPLD